MTKEQANELKVGIVVLVCLVLGLGVVLQLSNWKEWFEPKNTITFKVPYKAELGGIKSGWPVTIGGIEVGNIREIKSLIEARDSRDMADESKTVTTGAAENTESKAETTGVEAGAASAPEPASGEMTVYSYFIFTIPSRYQLRDDCQLTPASQLIGGEGELKITNLGSTGRILTDGDEVFRKNLGGSTMASIMETAQAAVVNVHRITETAQAAVINVHQITEDFKDVSDKAKRTMSISKPQLEGILANIRAASVEMKEGMREIRWNPWRLLHNPSDRELRTQNLLTAARAFSSGASDLDATASRLEGLLEAHGGELQKDDPELAEVVKELKASLARFTEAEEAFLKRLGKGQ